MATYTIRGTSHNVVYTYKAADGKRKQQWESYSSELEAIQRKAYIDYLQSQNRTSDITHEASEYRRKKAVEKAAQKIAAERTATAPDTPSPESEDNMSKTYREFMERFLPIHAGKKNFSPKTYDSYRQNLETHIYPYFGDWVMSSITSSAIDGFIDHLFQKPCRGSKSYGKRTSEIPTLSSGTVKKCYNILTLGFETAKRWNYIAEIPNTKGPSEHYKRRKAWSAEYISKILDQIQEDPILHLSLHLAFVCSLRAGEIVAIDIHSINLDEGSMWISQILERVSDEALKNNYQLVAANAGQSPEVLMHHYNEALEVEKQQLASMVESSFYPTPAKSNEKPASLDAAEILKLIQENPDLSAKLMQLLKVSA